jgi:hypothetical protein
MAEQITKMYRVTLEHDDMLSTITFNEYPVARQSEKCAWIDVPYRKEPQRVSIQEGGRQPFAFTTKKAALFAFIMRKKRHVRILRHTMQLMATALDTAKAKYLINDCTDHQISHYDF